MCPMGRSGFDEGMACPYHAAKDHVDYLVAHVTAEDLSAGRATAADAAGNNAADELAKKVKDSLGKPEQAAKPQLTPQLAQAAEKNCLGW